MPGVIGFKTIYDDEVAECLELTRFHLPTSRLLSESLCSFEDGTPLVPSRIRRPGQPFLRPPAPLRVGRHVVRCGGREYRFRGLVRIRKPSSVAIWMRRHGVPDPRTALAIWLGEQGLGPVGGDWDRASRRALSGLRSELSGHGYLPGDAMVVTSFPGLYATGREGCHELRRVEVGDRRLLARTWTQGLELRLERRIASEAGRVPVVLRLRLSEDSGCSWFDGRSFGVCDLPEDLPSALRARLEARGTAFDHGETSMRPMADLRPRFLLRVPTRRALDAAGGPSAELPACAAAPALLYPSTEPLPLLEPDGSLRRLPLVDEPGKAAAILARCSEGAVYVPSAPPIRTPDLDLQGPRWLVGSELLGAWT